MVKPEWLRKVQTEEVLIERVDILEKIRKSKYNNNEVAKAVGEMKKEKVKMLRDKEWREEDGIMLKEGKVYTPGEEGLRTEVIQLHHDTLVGEHGG